MQLSVQLQQTRNSGFASCRMLGSNVRVVKYSNFSVMQSGRSLLTAFTHYIERRGTLFKGQCSCRFSENTYWHRFTFFAAWNIVRDYKSLTKYSKKERSETQVMWSDHMIRETSHVIWSHKVMWSDHKIDQRYKSCDLIRKTVLTSTSYWTEVSEHNGSKVKWIPVKPPPSIMSTRDMWTR